MLGWILFLLRVQLGDWIPGFSLAIDGALGGTGGWGGARIRSEDPREGRAAEEGRATP